MTPFLQAMPMTISSTSILRMLVLAAAVLSGCSTRLMVILFNDSGEQVTVWSGGDGIVIGAAQSGRIAYPGDSQHWTIHLSTPRCDYSYAVPQTLDGIQPYQFSSDGLKVQIEGDFNIYLLPGESEDIVPLAKIASLQRGGFPLRPISQSCH